MTIYDRTLARLSRRERLRLAWMLGAAADAPPIVSRRRLANRRWSRRLGRYRVRGA